MAGGCDKREPDCRDGRGLIVSDRQRRLQLESTIKRVLQSGTLAQLEALAEVASAVDGEASGMSPRERVAEMRQSRDAQMLDELRRYEQQGRKREAAMLVAKRFAIDPRDPTEVESLAKRARRLRQRGAPSAAARNSDTVRIMPPKKLRLTK
jgi:hypothetical protein